MAQKDLIPMNKRTKEEVKKIARNGGIKSGEARRKKRDLKERFKLGLEIFTELKARELKLSGNEDAAKIVEEIGIETFTVLDIVNDEKSSAQIKLQAIGDILDRTEGKAIQKNLIDASVNAKKELTPQEFELIKKQLEKEAKKLRDNCIKKS